MDRQDRDRNGYGLDYDRYEGYRNDEHYHSARNLTDKFERDYQHDRGRWDDDGDRYSRNRTYHEGDMGDAYEQYRNRRDGYRDDSDYQRNDWDRSRNYSNNFSRDRYSNYQDDYRSYQGVDNRNGDRNQGLLGNIRQGYGISSFDGTSDRYNTLDSDQNRRGAGDDQAYYSGSRDGYRNSRFGGGMGESFPSSHRGVPDTNYGLRNFADNYGTGMGSSYGGKSYGGGTGYMSGHRGGSFGNNTYGTSAGNYGGYGSMGGGTYGGRSSSGRGDTSHNSNRGTTELGGF